MSDDPRDTAPGGAGGDLLAEAHAAVGLEQCALFVDSAPLSRSMTEGASTIRALIARVRAAEAERDSFRRNMEAVAGLSARYGAERDLALAVLREVAVLGHGKCTIGKPLAQMVRDVLDAVMSGATGKAVAPIMAERARQIGEERLPPEADDRYTAGELAMAAACYAVSGALGAGQQEPVRAGAVSRYWPWSPSWWKPINRRRDLERAGALIVAEIERLDRAAAKRAGGGE